MKTLALLIVCAASVALADDFKTINGKEYKNAKVSRVEPDGIVITFSGGIVKVPFNELSPEIQKKHGYEPQGEADFRQQQYQADVERARQTAEAQQRRAEERARYRGAHATPQPQQGTNNNVLAGTSLDRRDDRPAGSITPANLVSEYAASEIKADRLYGGRIFGMSGTIKSIFQSGGKTVIELLVPLTLYAAGDAATLKGKVRHLYCVFNDSRGLEYKQAGNAITLTGRVVGVREDPLTNQRDSLMIEDCHI
jgi:hypothetical protein